MSRLRVNWSVRRSDAEGIMVSDWHMCDCPDDAIALLAIRRTATVQLTFSDGSSEEYRVNGISDIGPNSTESLKY